MTRIELAKESIKLHEGFRGAPYNDRDGKTIHLDPPARLTVGYGRNLEAKPLSYAVADLMLTEDVAEAAEGAFRVWGDAFAWADLSEERAAILIEMCFQLGETGVRKFISFLEYAKARRHDEAATEMLNSKWAREDSPARARELARRWREDARA